MGEKFLIEADLGKKAVERCDVLAYLDGKLVGDYFDKAYDDLLPIANELRAQYPDTEIEVWCLGEDCCGTTHRWKIDIQC